MSKWRIENNVPIPPEHGGKGYAATIRKLKKGQSVLLPTSRKNLGGIVSYIGGKGAFVMRSMPGNKTRIWRMK